MGFLIGEIRHRGRAPSRRRLEKLAKTTATPTVFADGPAVLVSASEHEGAVLDNDELVILVDGWFTDPLGDRAQECRTAAAFLEAWKRWGVDVVRRLDGEFAIAVYERGPGVLHLLRDRTGVRPLYWARTDAAIAFSTRLPALLELPWISRELARDHLAEYLAFRVVHPPRTLIRDVRALPAGHRLRFGAEAVRVVRYHTPTYAAPNTPLPREQDVLPELQAAIERAVRRRLDNDRSIGVYLSGGAGSTAVTAAARAASRSLETFTVTFADEPFPEFPFAGRVARLLGMEHHTVTIGSQDIAQHFDDAITAMGHPVGNASVVLQQLLAKAAAAHVDVVITGDGADQLFGGQIMAEPARLVLGAERLQRLPAPIRGIGRRLLSRLDSSRDWEIDPEGLPLRRGIGGVHLFDERQRRALLLDELLVGPDIRTQVLEPFYGEVVTDSLNGALHAFFRSSLCADVLPRVTTTAMAAGVEPTFPLLDQEVQRLAQVLPGGFKLRSLAGNRPTRWMLRALLQGQLPPALIHRPDRGLPHPLDDWLQGPGRLFLEERTDRLREDPLELWHHTGIEGLRRHITSQPGASHRLWALFALDSWIRQVRAN